MVLDEDGLRVVAARTDHRPVEPTLGYRIEFDGKAVVVAGDTVPCAGLDELCKDADVYVQTVLRDDLVRMVPMQRFVDTIDYHSTVAQAAQTEARGASGLSSSRIRFPRRRAARPTSGSPLLASTSLATLSSAKTSPRSPFEGWLALVRPSHDERRGRHCPRSGG